MRKLLPFLFVLALAPHSLFGQSTASTVPVGVVTVTIPGTTGSPALTYFSAPLNGASSSGGQLAGLITSVTSTTLTNTAGGWTASQLSAAATPHFITIKSGSAAGYTFRITANTATQLTLDTQGLDLTTLGITAGTDSYEIFLGDTILSVFGTPSASNPIQGGTSPQNVDTVILHDGTSWLPYYFNTSTNTWRLGNSPIDRGNTVIRPDQGILYSRVASSSLTISFSGTVPSVQRKLLVQKNGLTVASNYFPVDLTLGSANLQTLPGWKKIGDSGVTSANADKVMLFSSGTWNAYYYDNTLGYWRLGASTTSQNSTSLPAGSAIVINRTGTSGTDVLTTALPYSL